MSDRPTKRESGFSLLEMTISIALGAIVLGAAVQIYIQGVKATWTTTQRAELQQDFRAASNILTKDLSLAGAGLTQGAAIALPSGTAPLYGCAQTASPYFCYINNSSSGAYPAGSVAYPTQGATYYLYGLLPGYNDGPTLLTAQGATDVVTVAYTDANLYLDCYTAAITSTTTVTFTLPTPVAPATGSANCTAPGGNAGVQAANDSAVGLTAGDLVLFTFGTTNVVAEVTAVTGTTAAGTVPAAGTVYTVTFAAGDALNMNQGKTINNSLAYQFTNGPVTGYATRILVISYYIDNSPNPPRLMQQVSGHSWAPVAENVVYMKFSYDMYNSSSGSAVVNQCQPGNNTTACNLLNGSTGSSGLLPNQITKINILNMAMDSTLNGSLLGQGGGYQRLDLQTSVSARNLTYVNNYPN
ncbi:MAG: prepilin-type N-terminal cleavage/methylation domain-containing protein [Terriglobales bacterium]|jgi:prepilin-type N-terminal cleavage/methylation domain-containing protein